jgi:tRNA nucleotidyltransferase (CCA-adding enzyme)
MNNLPQEVKDVLTKFNKAKFEAYIVGGSVRDLIMNKKTTDWDFTTNATPIEIMNIFPDSFYDNQYGTVGIKIYKSGKKTQEKPDEIFEITTYRSEKGYTDSRHPDNIIWGETLEEDLARRDLTINAMAYDGKKIIDPYDGQKDLENKIIRTVREPQDRFNEDVLRILRTIRITTQLKFTIEENTFLAVKKLAHKIHKISADRIRHELIRILESEYPADGIILLKNSELLFEILPELTKTFGVTQVSPNRHHIYDVGTHLLKSLENCPSKNWLVRFAALIHDIGKPVVFRKDDLTQMITFYNHEMVGTSIAKNIAHRLNFSKKDTEKLTTLIRWHQFTVDENQTDNTLRRFINRVGKENLQDIIDLRIGDRLGSGAKITSWRLRLFLKRLEEVQKQPFTVADLKIDGRDVMKLFNIPPGPQVGKILNELFDEVVLGKIKNEKKELMKRLDEIKNIAS